MYRVLFVCTGNTCRSPMAAGIFNKLVKERKIRNVIAESAGTMAVDGLPASPLAVAVAREHGISLQGHRSRALSKEIAGQATLLLTMTGQHWYDVTEFAPRESAVILARFGRSGPAPENEDIPDPIGGTEEDYRRVYHRLDVEIERSFPAVLQYLRTKTGSHPQGGQKR